MDSGFVTRWKSDFRNINENNFEEAALNVFRFQAEANPVYASYIKHLKIKPPAVRNLLEIPFLPILFFKSHQVVCRAGDAERVFTSSGTTGGETSRHYVYDPDFYVSVARRLFENAYGDLSVYTLFALLPSYLERGGSSLVYMVDSFMQHTRQPSGFYLDGQAALREALLDCKNKGQKCLLIGVTFALLDMAENCPLDFPELIVMETGGMKGRKKEMIRDEVHEILKKGFGVSEIHSEYGMTELFSQFYAAKNGLFAPAQSARALIRETNDPFCLSETGSGGINIIDLANIDSCCFIETQDVGRRHANGLFEVLGRFDNSMARGCNLLVV